MYFTPISALRQRLAFAPEVRVFDRSVERFLQNALSVPGPAVGSEAAATGQDDKAYTLTFDLPGVAKDQLDIQIEGNQVRIQTKPEAARRYSAAYEFASEIDTGASQAKLENGVLTLTLVKLAPVSKALPLAVN